MIIRASVKTRRLERLLCRWARRAGPSKPFHLQLSGGRASDSDGLHCPRLDLSLSSSHKWVGSSKRFQPQVRGNAKETITPGLIIGSSRFKKTTRRKIAAAQMARWAKGERGEPACLTDFHFSSPVDSLTGFYGRCLAFRHRPIEPRSHCPRKHVWKFREDAAIYVEDCRFASGSSR